MIRWFAEGFRYLLMSSTERYLGHAIDRRDFERRLRVMRVERARRRRDQCQQADQRAGTDRRIQCHSATTSSRREDGCGRTDEDEHRGHLAERQVFKPNELKPQPKAFRSRSLARR